MSQIASQVIVLVATAAGNLGSGTVPLNPTQSNFPMWMLYFSFWVSLVLALLRIGEHFSKAIRGCNLEIRLTKEAFLRIIDSGECWFINCVAIANETLAIIEGVTGTLEKTDSSTKSFPLEFLRLGEKFRNSSGIPEFYFHSSSPINAIPVNNPQRLVFLFSIKDYSANIKEAFDKFNFKLLESSIRFKELAGQSNSENNPEIIKIIQEAESLVNTVFEKIYSLIQIEQGKYKFTVKVKYRQKGFYTPLFYSKEASSVIHFLVDPLAKEHFKNQLKKLFRDYAANSFFNKDLSLVFPEYHPNQIFEGETP